MDILFTMNLQNSFLSHTGSVYMEEKAEILKVRLVDYLSSHKGEKLFFREVHAMEDTFFSNDKTHSIATTSDCIVHELFRNHVKVIFDHTRYDAFFNTNLENYLKREKVTSVTIVGVETHTSVLFTAESLRNRNYPVTIIEPCCMSRDEASHAGAVSIMINSLGVRAGM